MFAISHIFRKSFAKNLQTNVKKIHNGKSLFNRPEFYYGKKYTGIIPLVKFIEKTTWKV